MLADDITDFIIDISEGNKNSRHVIIAEQVIFLGRKNEQE